MADLRNIAERLAARRATFAKPRVPPKEGIDRSFEIFARYPTVTFICLTVGGGLVATLIGWIALSALSGVH